MFDHFPIEINLKIIRYLEFIADVESFISAIGVNGFGKKLVHHCDDRCLEYCQHHTLTDLTPVQFVQTDKQYGYGPIFYRHKGPLSCDFLQLRLTHVSNEFTLDSYHYHQLCRGKNRLVFKNHSGDIFILNIHLKNSSTFQLENCKRLLLCDSTVGRSYQRFRFGNLRSLVVYGFTNDLFNLLDLERYPRYFLLLSRSSKITWEQFKPIHLNNWKNESLRAVKLDGLRTVENVNLPNVRVLHLLFIGSREKDDLEISLVNNLNAPNLQLFILEIENGCPPLMISNVCIGTTAQELEIRYVSDCSDTSGSDSSDFSSKKGFILEPVDGLGLPSDFVEIKTSLMLKKFETLVGDETTRTVKKLRLQMIKYKLEKVKKSEIDQSSLMTSTKLLKFNSYLKVDPKMNMKIGLINLMSIEHITN